MVEEMLQYWLLVEEVHAHPPLKHGVIRKILLISWHLKYTHAIYAFHL